LARVWSRCTTGRSPPRNAGARAARGEFLIFVDAHTVVTEAMVCAAADAMRGGAVGGGSAFRFDGPLPLHGRLLQAVPRGRGRRDAVAPHRVPRRGDRDLRWPHRDVHRRRGRGGRAARHHPGVARRTAETIVAELGCDMTRFPTAGHAASWAGLCPGNHESAGKRLSGRTRFASRGLRQALVESARGAVRKRNSYLAAQYRRLVKRRGDKKAIVAVAHSILVIAYHVLRDSQSYRELGGDYFDRLNTDRLTRYHTKRLAALGYTVTLAKHAA
jgi:Transposase IS116/IS110/IS902 family/Glycosyl transferase family 2